MPHSHWHRHKALGTVVLLLVGVLSFVTGMRYGPTTVTNDSRPQGTFEPLLLPHERLVVINIEGNTLSATISVSDVDDVIKRCAAMYHELRATMKRSELPRMELYTLRAVVRDGSYTVEIDRPELISPPAQRSPTARRSVLS